MKRHLLLAALAAALSACGGGGSNVAEPVNAPAPPAAPPDPPPAEPPAYCSVQDQRNTLDAWMQDNYLWSDQLHAADAQAASLDAYFQSLLYKPLDRYSYTESTASFNQLFVEGRRTGYGYTLVWADAAQTVLRVRNVEPLSPIAKAGLQRGHTIVSIDGYTPAQVAAGQPAPVSVPGVPRTFRIRDANGNERTIDAASADFPLSPVGTPQTFIVSRSNGTNANVGYLTYGQFVGYSRTDLLNAMRTLRQAGIDELVLDLRYNGGGSVATSRDLASFIGSTTTAGQLYTYLRFNDKQVAQNLTYRFLDLQQIEPIVLPQLKRLVVLTSGGTASASELLINGLKPFLPVVLVGDTTYGKPFGFVPRDYCGITYNAVNFRSLNGAGQSDFDKGFKPDCAAADDLDHALGDRSERKLATALNYIATGSCPAAPQARVLAPAAASRPLGETVEPGMFPN
jgi:C-terminal processing protease CtpA/Prc